MTTDVISNFRVTSLGLDTDRLDVIWDYVDDRRSLEYEVWVEKSGSISGPFSVVAKTYGARAYTDYSVIHDTLQVQFYRLRVVKRQDSSVVQVTNAQTYGYEVGIVAKEIRRRTNLLLREYTGVPVLYYPIRTTGQRCPDCWSSVSGQRDKSNCRTCFDTGFLTGFYTPILTYVQMRDDQFALTQNPETDETSQQTSNAIVSGDLPLEFGDMIVEQNNRRWLVAMWDDSELLRAHTSYRVKLHFLQKNDIRYKVPIPEEDIFAKAYRNREYSRPYTLSP